MNGMGKQNLLQDEYATKDLHFAAFLQVKGMIIKKLEQLGRGVRGQNPVYFIFSGQERCKELEDIFWNGVGDEVMVNAKDYFTAIRDLRARVFSITRGARTEKPSLGEIIEEEEKWRKYG
jgi:hypothetical protein